MRPISIKDIAELLLEYQYEANNGDYEDDYSQIVIREKFAKTIFNIIEKERHAQN